MYLGLFPEILRNLLQIQYKIGEQKGKIHFLMRDFVNMDVKDSEMKIKFKIYFLIHLHLIQHHHELVCKSD